MSGVEFEILSVTFANARQYKLIFQDGLETEVAGEPSTNPTFNNRRFLGPIVETQGDAPNFSVTVIDAKGGAHEILAQRKFYLSPAHQRRSQTLSFTSNGDGVSLEGTVTIDYRFTKLPVTHALKGDRVYCLSVQAAHLNTLVETQFNLTLIASPLTDMEAIAPPVQLNNKEPFASINLVHSFDSLGAQGMTLIVKDNTTGRWYRVTVTPLSPVVVSIPMSMGDPLVLTLQCMYTMEERRQVVTGLVHTSFMREAQITQTPGSTARKISLSPRRTTTFDQSAAAVGLLGTGQAIPSTKKTLLYLEDSQLNVRTTPNSAIIGGIQCAEEIDPDGNVVSTRPIENFHEAYLTEISARTHGEDQKHRYIGPATGAYVICNSKSEMLNTDVNKKTHKKQSLTINLGTLQVAQSTLTGPVKIRAKLVDLLFSTVGGGVDALGNVDTASKHQQKAVIAYIGLLEEASRELFNDTGLIACTLEGKLFKPSSTAASAAASLAGDGSTTSGSAGTGAAEGEETCVAVKLYVSLVPSREESHSPEHSDSEDSGTAEGTKAHTAKSSRRGSHRGSAPGSNTASAESLHQSKSRNKVGFTKEGKPADGAEEAEGASSDVQRRINANEPYNIVDQRNALPDELHGSSSLLAVPSHHASQRSSAAELKKSKSGASVPALPLGGMAAGSQAASAASLKGHVTIEESRFLGAHSTHSASADSIAESDFGIAKSRKGAFGEALVPAAVGRAQAGGHKHAAAAGVAFAEVVRAELEQKQRLVDELMEDLRVRNEAIQVCGFDIRSLREETIRLNNKIAAMEAEKEHKAEAERQADMKTSEILKYPNLMQELDKPTLIRNMHRLRERVNGLDRDKSALEGALHQAKDVITEFVTLKKDHTVLQGAHLEQTKYLQKMQGKIAQISAYQETIKTQEKVITKMQTIVESKLRSKNALPFQTKTVPPNSQIPVPREDPFAVLGGLPDFEALQAQKMNEEALLQARLEVEELTDKVRDLEHQLFEAKLAQYDTGKDSAHGGSDLGEGSDAGSEDRDEREAPSSSVLQDMTPDERAKFENLQTANARIDELEAENTAKSYRISALEAQLESSTRDYSREIARLRTKLFELEITAAMAGDRPGSGEGDDDVMDMDLDALLQIPDPGAKNKPPSPPGATTPHTGASSGAARAANASRDGVANSTSRESLRSPTTPPGGPAGGLVRMNSFLRSPAAGSGKHAPPQGAEEDEVGFSAPGSRPPSGSARAAALSIKSNTTAAAPQEGAEYAEAGGKKRKLSARTNSGDVIDKLLRSSATNSAADVKAAADALDKLEMSPRAAAAESTTGQRQDDAEKQHSPKGSAASSHASLLNKKGNSAPASKHASHDDLAVAPSLESLRKVVEATKDAKHYEGAATPLKKSSTADSAEKLSPGPSPPATAPLSPPKGMVGTLPGAAPTTTVRDGASPHPVSEHPPNEAEPLVRVPKFRRKSGDDNGMAPKLGIGPQGPIDPDAIEKTVELTMQIIDNDQVSPRAEATVRTKKDNKIVLAILTLTVHYLHDHIRKASTFKVIKVNLHGYSQDLFQNRFDPYLKMNVGSKWKCVTGSVRPNGATAEWVFDPDHGLFDKKFVLTEAEMASPGDTTMTCVVKKKNERAHEDFECGVGSLLLTKSMFE